jgi:hypothetical protein
MKPTNRLRFVTRKMVFDAFYMMTDGGGKTVPAQQTIRVLQQWWEDSVGDIEQGITAFGEWRDVPLETEE